MAESGSASNDGMAPPAPSSSAAAPPDWEFLTMSMSSVAPGKPQGNDRDNASEKSNPQIENSLLNEESFASDVWMTPLHASVSLDSGDDAEAEPFTEGWKPHLSASGLYGYGGDRNVQEVILQSEGTETYFDSSNASMGTSGDLLVSEKDHGDVEKRVLAYNHSTEEVDTDHGLLKEKFKSKRGKQPKKLSKVIWSLAVAASVVGIVILGYRLRAAYSQNQQLQDQLSAKEERLNELLLQVDRMKKVVGDPRRTQVSRN